VRDRAKEYNLSFSYVVKATKALTALTPEMDSNQAAIGLPPVISVVFLIAKSSAYLYIVSKLLFSYVPLGYS
jgi:hypothetical protein